MTMNVEGISQDTVSVELIPDENDEAAWIFLAHLSSILWTNYGLDLDCDTIVITLVYGSDGEERPQAAPQASES